MQIDPIMQELVGGLFIILLIGLVSQRLRQPHVVGYILGGVLLEPSGFGLISDELTLSRPGSFGVVLLLFFIGMEVSPRRLMGRWKVAVNRSHHNVQFASVSGMDCHDEKVNRHWIQ